MAQGRSARKAVLTARPGRGSGHISTLGLDDTAQLDPGLVLFFAWLVWVAERRTSAVAAAAAAGT